jgi:hypothetical protein
MFVRNVSKFLLDGYHVLFTCHIFLTLKIEAVSVSFYQTTQRHVPEDGALYCYRREDFKFQTPYNTLIVLS